MTPVLLCVLVSAASLVLADYDCVCNYNVEQQVLNAQATTATVIGYMYEFDCKENVPLVPQDSGWLGVAYEHHLGYVKADSSIQLQVCQGSPPVDDKIVATTPLPATVATTTPKPTTTTPKPTTTTTTPKPTTTSTTTPIPTTTTTTTPKPTTTPTTPKPTTTTTTPKPTTTTTPKPTTTPTTPKPTTTTTTPKPTTTTTPKPTTTPTTPKPTTTTTTTPKPTTTTTTTPKPTTTTTTPKPTTTTTTTPKPTTTAPTTTPVPTTTTTTTTTPKPTTTTTTPKPTTTTTTRKPTTTTHQPTTRAPVTIHIPTYGSPCYYTYNRYASMIKGTLESYGRYCYEFVPQATLWLSAETDCVTKGGHLATITSSQEQNFIYSYLQKYYNHEVWIGLHDHQVEKTFQWTSGHAVTYTHWSPDVHSNIFHDLTDCVMLDTAHGGFWQDRQCDVLGPKHYGYVCQYGLSVVVPATQAPNTYAPWVTNAVTTHTPHTQPVIHTGFSEGNTGLCSRKHQLHSAQHGTILAQHGRYCYELIPDQRMTWRHCEQLCENGGGNLVHIASASEQAWVQTFVQRHSPRHAVWIGLHDLMNEGHYEWSSGDRVTYLNFVPGHLSNYNDRSVEDCFVLIPYKGGKWDDIVCGSSTTTLSIFGHQQFIDHGAYPPFCQFPIASGVSLIG